VHNNKKLFLKTTTTSKKADGLKGEKAETREKMERWKPTFFSTIVLEFTCVGDERG
jgi:hypothetical protein